jgi:two-component system, chemotaxis family, protein-glutamate methylesterase/glutaminase
MPNRIVVIGASAGGVRALQVLAAQLAPDFAAPILAVQHVGSYPSVLPSLLSRQGPLPAAHAVDGQPLVAGQITIAPPDHHMLVERDVIRLTRGPKEHHARPAIDPLFRSAALNWGPAAIGVVLTGLLDDGTPGLQAIKQAGGTVVVQDPEDAESPSMPVHALRHVAVDHKVPLAAMGKLLTHLVATVTVAAPKDKSLVTLLEQKIMLREGDPLEHLREIGSPSTFVCPDCQGTLFEIADMDPRRFRCHTGHAYTLLSLHHAQSEATDDALWGAVRALQEKEHLLKAMAESHSRPSQGADAERLQKEAEKVSRHAQTLRLLIESIPRQPGIG